MRVTSSRSGSKQKIKEPYNIPIGSEYDISFDMTETFEFTTGKLKTLNLSNLSGTLNSTTGTSRSKVSGFSTTRSKSVKNSSRAQSKVSTLNLTDHILAGANSTAVRQVGVMTPRYDIMSQSPMSISRYGSRAETARPMTVASERPDFPNGKVQTYVFGFEKPIEYIPKVFVSSHRPKSAKAQKSKSRVQKNAPELTLSSRAKLSSKRSVTLSKGDKLCSSVVLSQFEELNAAFSH